MLFLLLAIACSAMVSVFLRLSAEKTKNDSAVLVCNYLTCGIVACFYIGTQGIFPNSPALPATLGMGVVHGILYLVVLVLFQRNVQKNGVVLSSVFMKLGLLVPMVLSIFLFREIPTAVQCLGFVIAIAAIVLINQRKGATTSVSPVSLILLLLCAGSADSMTKIFESLGQASHAAQFLLYTFLVAFILSIGLLLKKKQRIGICDVLFGILVGIPNFFSTKFLLRALEALPAVVAYPVFSVGTLLVITLAGVLLFREALSKKQWFAVAAILVALILLNM